MDVLKAALVRALLAVAALLPLRLARALGRFAARIYWPFRGRSRRVTQKNIELAFPDLIPAERASLSWQSLAATGELLGEMGHVWLRPWRYVQGLILSVEGEGLVREALAAGRGVLILAPHLGNWELVGLHLATLGKTVSMYEPPGITGLDALIRNARQGSGALLVATDRRGIATLCGNLEAGGIVGILPDQVPGKTGSGRNVPFMGVTCFTSTLPSALLRRSGALAVYAYALREADGFRLFYEFAEDAVYSEDVPLALAAMNVGIEACVRQAPAQYQWEYKRFRTRPRTRPGIYDER